MSYNYEFCSFFEASLSFLYAFLATLAMIRLGWAHDVPNDRSSHIQATPTLGGISFAVPMLVTLYGLQPLTVLLSLVLILCVGGLDDMLGLSYRTRLAAQGVASVMVMSQLPWWSTSFACPTFVVWIATLFLLVGLMNGTNFIDGLNGLLAGCVMMALLVWWAATPAMVHTWAIALAGILAFWLFNRHGSIFMGDLGSTFLGLWIGITALSMQAIHTEPAIGGLCTQGLLLTLAPLMFVWGDVSITLSHRWWRGEVLSQAHREHIIHRLADAGYGHTRVAALYMMSVLYMGGMTLLYCHHIIHLVTYITSYLVPQTALVWWAFRLSWRETP